MKSNQTSNKTRALATPIRRRRLKDRRGATLVEFAIVAQIFFLITLSCIEFVRLNMIRNLVQDAAYFGARVAMVPGATSGEAAAEAERILSTLATRGAKIVVNDGEQLDNDTDYVEVDIRVPVTENALIVPTLFSGGRYFESTVRISTERYDGFYDGT